MYINVKRIQVNELQMDKLNKNARFQWHINVSIRMKFKVPSGNVNLFTCLLVYLFTCLLVYLFTCLLVLLHIMDQQTHCYKCKDKYSNGTGIEYLYQNHNLKMIMSNPK